MRKAENDHLLLMTIFEKLLLNSEMAKLVWECGGLEDIGVM